MKSFPEQMRRITLTLVLIAMLMAQPVQAEGSDELSDFELAQGGNARVALSDRTNLRDGVPTWVVFEVYLQAGETLHLGSNTIHTGDGNIFVWTPGTDVYTNSYPAAGVFASAIVNCVTQAAGNANYGLIDTFTKEQAGPLPNPGGYQSCQYTAPAAGIYPLMFTASASVGGTNHELPLNNPNIPPQQQYAHAWDATVRDAGGSEQSGRLFTNAFMFWEVSDPDQRFYIYTRDGYQYLLQYDEMGGMFYSFFINNKGVKTLATGEPTYTSWLSSAMGGTYNFHKPYDPDTADDVTHKIFINPPDPVVITGTNGLRDTLGYSATPIGASPPSNLQFDGAPVGGGDGWAPNPPWAGNAIFTFDSAPSLDGLEYSFTIDANKNGSYDDAIDWRTSGIYNSAGNSISYDGLDGLGAPLGGNTSYPVRTASLAGELHFPMTDVEVLGGIHIERLNDLSAGDIFKASYDDFNGTALTTASPISLPQGGDSSPFGNGFRGYAGADPGNEDVLDTWAHTGVDADASITIDILMGAPAPAPAPAPAALPSTGFPRGLVTALPKQPAAKAYTETAMMLSIPSLSVDMPIVGVPQSGDGWDVAWLGNNAGWLNGSAFPTWAGNTVITGHVWDASNNPGPFVNLKDLRYGDQVQIEAWGLTHTYEVRESKLLLPNRVDTVMQHEEYDWLTLVTCEDYQFLWKNYSFRRIVRAVLVSVEK